MVLVPVLAEAWVELVQHHAGGEPRRPRGARRRGAGTGARGAGGEVAVGWVGLGRGRRSRGWPARGRSPSCPGEDIWSINCFVVARAARRSGVAKALLAAAVEYARDHGARLVEGYPVGDRRRPDPVGVGLHGDGVDVRGVRASTSPPSRRQSRIQGDAARRDAPRSPEAPGRGRLRRSPGAPTSAPRDELIAQRLGRHVAGRSVRRIGALDRADRSAMRPLGRRAITGRSRRPGSSSLRAEHLRAGVLAGHDRRTVSPNVATGRPGPGPTA